MEYLIQEKLDHILALTLSSGKKFGLKNVQNPFKTNISSFT